MAIILKNKNDGEIMRTLPIAILDSAFSAFISFILAFLIINFYIERPFSIIFSICIAVPIFIIAFGRIKKSMLSKSAENKKRKAVENMVYSLCLLERAKLLELFERAINNLDLKTLKKKHGIFVENKNLAIFPIFNFDGITKTDVVKVYNSVSLKQKAYILGDDIKPEVKSFMNRFSERIEFVEAEKVYHFLEKTNSLPQERFPNLNSTDKHKFFKKLIKKKHANKFLIFGITFILSSWFVPIKTYYVICGCIFLMLSLICRLYGQEKETE